MALAGAPSVPPRRRIDPAVVRRHAGLQIQPGHSAHTGRFSVNMIASRGNRPGPSPGHSSSSPPGTSLGLACASSQKAELAAEVILIFLSAWCAVQSSLSQGSDSCDNASHHYSLTRPGQPGQSRLPPTDTRTGAYDTTIRPLPYCDALWAPTVSAATACSVGG